MNEINKYYNDDKDTDLLKIVRELWYRKKIIFIVTILFALSAFIFGLYAKSTWVSVAVVAQSSYKIEPDLQRYKNIIPEKDFDYIFKDLNKKTLFDMFVNIYNSPENKKEFIINNKFLTKYKDSSQSYSDNLKYYINQIGSIKVGDYYKLSTKGITDKDSFQLLTKYITYCNDMVNNRVFLVVNTMASERIIKLSSSLKLMKNEAEDKIYSEILKSKVELKIALAAGVKKPFDNDNGSQLFSINLGSNGIEEKIKILSNNKDDVVNILNYRIKGVEDNLKRLIKMKENMKLNTFSSFDYIKNPSIPTKKYGFSLFMKISIGLFLGMCISILLIFITSALKEK